jgi:hypothetical protein
MCRMNISHMSMLRVVTGERGAALFITLILMVALVAVSAGAILMTGTEWQLRAYSKTQVDLRYSAAAAAEMGLSRLNRDEQALPDTGYKVLDYRVQLTDAFGEVIPEYELDIYAGRSGSATGSSGNFASVVGQATGRGATSIVRLEVTEESFAKFAYFTDNEGGNIWFAGGDQLLGPVHSNDRIKIHSTGATFYSEVTTGRNVLYPDNGTFMKGFEENVDTIPMPDNTDLVRMGALAQAAGTFFTTPSIGGAGDVEMRIEYVAVDVNGDGDDVDEDEGFFRIYRSPFPYWLAAQGTNSWTLNCGDVHNHPISGDPTFVSARNHRELYRGEAYSGPYAAEVAAWKNHAALRHGIGGTGWNAVYEAAVSRPTSRCYLGGDPRLMMDSRSLDEWDGTGNDNGWLRREDFAPNMSVPAAIQGRDDADFLFPLSRDYNPDFRGVLFFDGLIGVSGVLNGRVTIVTNDNIVLLDDFTYSVPANAAKCNDISGFLTAHNFYISDNNLNTPQRFPGVGGSRRTYDDTASEFIDGVILALDRSFTVENYWTGPRSSEACEGSANGRGCLYLTGGLIQQTRGAVGLTSGEGYIKRYAYDSNARFCPPPHFPTTGRYVKNRYYEVNPRVFEDVASFFAELR